MIHKADEVVLLGLKKKIDTCPICNGTNLKCSCYGAYYLAFQIITSDIPLKYRGFTLEDISSATSEKNVARIRKYMSQLDKYRRKGTGLYLYGNTGTAKSVFGCIILIEALRKGYTCKFATVDQYRTAVLEKQYDLLTNFQSVDFLLLDDVGREFHDSKGLVDSVLDDLIRLRSDSLLPTIMTTNKEEPDTFRLSSILKEHFIRIVFDTADYRKQIEKDLKKT